MREAGRAARVLMRQTLDGNRRALAQLISLVESNPSSAAELTAELHARGGRAAIVGVTGAPGTGKSTLVNELCKSFRRDGCRVGVIAVDPSSPFSGGALLGDRIRMRDLAGDDGVFIRSMATRGNLGGLARATADAVRVLDAAGFEMVVIETVGVGQGELEIARRADTVLVVEAPGLGDEVQAMKAGILEIADILVVNKADREGADDTVRALRAMVNLGSPLAGDRTDAWRAPVLKTVAVKGTGVADVAESIARHRGYLERSGTGTTRRRLRAADELETILRDLLLERGMQRISRVELDTLVERVAAREIDPYAAACRLLGGPI